MEGKESRGVRDGNMGEGGREAVAAYLERCIYLPSKRSS